ncbi:hypothetical protein A4G99_19005 [Haladaptatus sp. R4]|uniref:hypothetical protein n=1 Tax=Haladaptatus sp. R4 TaxID=1679489 RepID=UPI0007B4F69F|nr:hypothetical protein [Haladaptatus sp. R4]KZN22559.1 hypothetical protein A4G99_19005 [Haladaptatus sp. R4]
MTDYSSIVLISLFSVPIGALVKSGTEIVMCFANAFSEIRSGSSTPASQVVRLAALVTILVGNPPHLAAWSDLHALDDTARFKGFETVEDGAPGDRQLIRRHLGC